MGKFSITNWIGPLSWVLRLAGLTLHQGRYQEFSHSWQAVRDILDLCNAAQVRHYQVREQHNGNLRPTGEHCRLINPTDTNWIPIPDWQDRRSLTQSNASSRSYDRLLKYTDSDLDRVVAVVRYIVLAEPYPWDEVQSEDSPPPPPPAGIDWTTGREIR